MNLLLKMYCVQQKVTDDVSITRPTLIWMGPVLLISLTSGKIVLQHIWCSWTFISYPEWHENDLYISFYVMVFPFFTNLYSKSLCLMQTPWDVKPSQLYTFICNWVTHNYQFRAIDAAMRAHLLVYNLQLPYGHHGHNVGLPPRLASYWIISSQISPNFLKFPLIFSISSQPNWQAGTVIATLMITIVIMVAMIMMVAMVMVILVIMVVLLINVVMLIMVVIVIIVTTSMIQQQQQV